MDLRDYIRKCEEEGELKRIKAEVDWDLEISHIAKLVEERSGPALLFENVKGYKSPVLTGAFGTNKRLAIILGKSPNLSMVQLTKEWVNVAVKEVIRAKEQKDGPIFENILDGDKIIIDKLAPISYCPNVHEYRAIGEKIGNYGFSKKGKE